MATLGNANDASQQNTSRRSYISTAPFDQFFYTYTTHVSDFKTTASLDPVVGATCETCPIGRILRENGRKLYPDPALGIQFYMVGVYDSITFLSGYIHPNANVFAIYNSDRPNYIADDGDSSDEETEGSVDYQEGPPYGPPVLTSGNVVSSEGFVGIQSTIKGGETYAGAYLYDGEPIVEAGVNYPVECPQDPITPYTYATLYPDGTIQSILYTEGPSSEVTLTADGNTFNTGNTSTMGKLDVQGNISSFGTVAYGTGLRVPEPLIGTVTLIRDVDANNTRITAVGITSNSRVFLTPLSSGHGILSVHSINSPANTFTIYSSYSGDNSQVQYFIVN